MGAISIGLLTFIPPELITLYLPGGNVTPLIGISIAHGIIVPIMIAIIPHTVTPVQVGMAFAVVEVLGNTLNLTDIVFGWLRDISGTLRYVSINHNDDDIYHYCYLELL